MNKRSNSDSTSLKQLERASRNLDHRIQELEALLGNAPTTTSHSRFKHDMNRGNNTMPPPERVLNERQTRTKQAVIARRGTAHNSRKELGENFMLLVLLVVAVATSSLWIFRLLEQQ